MRISDWSSDVCSSDLAAGGDGGVRGHLQHAVADLALEAAHHRERGDQRGHADGDAQDRGQRDEGDEAVAALGAQVAQRSEEHTSELQSLMRISYAVFCLKKKTKNDIKKKIEEL